MIATRSGARGVIFFCGNYPVSTLIEISKLVRPELCVEIEAVGYLPATDET